MECQVNHHASEEDTSISDICAMKEDGFAHEALGCNINVVGISKAEVGIKQSMSSPAIRSKHQFWPCAGVLRRSQISLMHKVATSSSCWSVVTWTVTRGELSCLRGIVPKHAKKCLNILWYWIDSEKLTTGRSTVLKRTLSDAGLAHVDAYVVKRMFDYAAVHVVRAMKANLGHPDGVVFGQWDSRLKVDSLHGIRSFHSTILCVIGQVLGGHFCR